MEDAHVPHVRRRETAQSRKLRGQPFGNRLNRTRSPSPVSRICGDIRPDMEIEFQMLEVRFASRHVAALQNRRLYRPNRSTDFKRFIPRRPSA